MSDPWFRFFPSDWLAGTSGLSAAERGVYITLLAMMYDHGGSIKRDDERLARRCGLPIVGFRRALEALIAENKILFVNGELVNERAKREFIERESYSLAQSNNASSRWKKRKQNQSKHHASALPPQCEANAAHDGLAMPIPQPQPHSDNLPAVQLTAARDKLALDRIEAALREASGLQESPAPRLADLSPILGFMDAGVSLEQTILPVLRTKRGKCDRARSWDYFSEAIRESFDKRSAAAASSPPLPAPGEEIIRNGAIEMPAKNLERMLRRYGDDPESWNPIHGDPPPENPFLVKFAAERGIAIPDKHPDPRGPRLVKFIGEAAG